MVQRIIISADDFGLSRGVTDSILETFDKGALTSVSLLANGESVEHALIEYRERQQRLRLAVHLNLTEGPALSPASRIPHLVDERGMFKYSPVTFLLVYLLSFPARRRRLREEVICELGAQWERVRSDIHVEAADGHQHVHMIPFIFDIVATLPETRADIR